MKKIDVPLYLQKEDSSDCGPVAVQMILDYFGIKRTLEDLDKKLARFEKDFTSTYDCRALLLDEGLGVIAITANPLLFPPDVISKLKTSGDIKELINNKIAAKHKRAKVLKTFIKYLDKGGKFLLKIPTFADIKQAIDKNNIVGVSMYSNTMGSNEGGYHFVVATGYRDNQVFINNSWPKSKKQGWFDIDQFLYGVYAASCVDVDNSAFLVVSKK